MSSPMTEKDLFEIIRRQAEQIDHLIAENKALKAENARLRKRIEELERKGRKYVAPHSRETRKADPKPPGRRPGQGPFTYKQPPSPEQVRAVVEVAAPNTCGACGFTGELLFKRQDQAWISELVKDQALVVTEYHVPVMTCPTCGRTVRGQHADTKPK